MKKGFTLLELIIVIIIIGVLATLGLTQYGRMIEKARGAEARAVLGSIRTNAAAIYMQNSSSCSNCAAGNVGIGNDYPITCATTHYFSYSITPSAAGFVATATRCMAGGKSPQGPTTGTVTLTTNLTTAAAADAWTTSGEY